MYKSLYRKYRPQNFDDVHGQEVVVKILTNQIKNNTLSHAYLFSGPRGTGKTSVAKILAKTINCLELKNSKPCNNCVNCTQKNNELDIIEIDAASNNGVDEIRELKNKSMLVPVNGKYKVYIIDEVHMLTIAAFNALLKTLEEPPKHVIFILATTDLHKVPETILSRCQKFDFKRISNININDRLKQIIKLEKIKITDDAILEIARLSNGGMRDAIGMLELTSSYVEMEIKKDDVHDVNGSLSQEKIFELVKYICEGNIKKIIYKIDEFNNSGKNLVKIIEELILFFRNCIVARKIKNYFETTENKEIYEEINKLIKEEKIIEYINIINKTIINLKNYNNPKILIEILMINLVDVTEDFKVVLEKANIVEKKEEKKEINMSNNVLEALKFKRVNNTFASVSKSLLDEVKENIKKIDTMNFNQNYDKLISIILDGKIKAASKKNLIFVYESETVASIFNENLIEIEKIISKILKNDYNVIALDENIWERHRRDFKSKQNKYIYLDETEELTRFLKTKKNNESEIEKKFKDLIEIK